MDIESSPRITQHRCLELKKESTLALVPTMGCLHEGHLALVKAAKEKAEKVVVSIFVNPLQFAPHEDFDRYPRQFDEDCELLEAAGVDLVFHPGVQDFYPAGFQTRVTAGPLSEFFCGISRPHFFHGVATVCLKLFQTTQPNIAIFGEKDFQQLRVLEQMVNDFHLPMRIVRFPTVREADGLALSSRNQYLSPEERSKAPILYELLTQTRSRALQGALVEEALAGHAEKLQEQGFQIDYFQVASEWDLKPQSGGVRVNQIQKPRALIAAKLGTTRLIDNLALYEDPHHEKIS